MLKPFAFVLMPFEEGFNDVYTYGIQAAAKDAGIVAERVDEQRFTESILERIYRQIESADLVIADMTGKNPNVFYEVGFAHAKDKPCVLLTQNAEDIPFDLKHHHHIIYGGSIKELRSKLTPHLEWLKAEIHKNQTEPISISLESIFGRLQKSEFFADVEVELVIRIENKTKKRSPEIETGYLYTGPTWIFNQGGEDCPAKDVTNKDDYTQQHLIKPPVTRLSPGAWADIKIACKKTVWSKFSGAEEKDSYKLTGHVLFELLTSEGTYEKKIVLDVECDEFPF